MKKYNLSIGNFSYQKFGLIYLLLLFSLESCAQQLAGPVAHISTGYIKGIQEEHTFIFKGIPYAKPPLGELRFKAPQAPENWKDTLSCQQFGNVAAQAGNTVNGLQGSEDCLSLNVYTPKVSAAAKLPVVVWVHGGGMTGGSGKSMNGRAFSEQDSIVTVTINYRLGLFGFLYLGDKDRAYNTSGNNGLLDCMMALKWIRQNIAQLGGDPARVTVMGQSAGAKLVSTLLLAPEAKGYFSQLILESGSVQCVRDTVTAKAIRQRLEDILTPVKSSTANESLKTDLKFWKAISTAELIAAQNKVLGGAKGTNYFGPVADGQVISGNPYTYIKKGTDPALSVLIGTNTGESRMFMEADKRLYRPDAIALRDWFGDNYKFALAATEKTVTEKNPEAATVSVLTQYMYQMHAYRLMASLAENGNQVWSYRLSYSKDGKGANHAQELKYVWYLPGSQDYDEVETKLSHEMHPLWVNFIRGHKPGGINGQDWPLFNNKKPAIMNFDRITAPLLLKNIYNDKDHPAAGFILN
jgi:para-nitrobenzyl esterase